jgi:hypothetical protein
MKKKIILCFSLVFANFLVAQQSVSISGPTSVEVGIPYNYTFTFNPLYPSNSTTGAIADSYIITEWIVLTGTNGNSGTIAGYIGTPSNQSSYYYNGTYNNSNPFIIPIQWGDGTYLRSDYVTVKVSGIYRKSSTGENIGYFNFLQNTLQIPTVERMVSPIISGETSVLNCDQTNKIYSISNATYANQFFWTATGGALIVGSSTGTSVIVTPPLTGNYSVNCTTKRSSANANYNKSSSKSVVRNSRTVTFTALYPEYSNNSAPIPYICKGAGRQMSMPTQSGITNINWVAVGCSIIGQNTLTPTIIPLSSTTTGSNIDVYAVVTFTGGCLSTTPIKSFRVFDSSNATTPTGELEVTQSSFDENEWDINLIDDTSTNGIITIFPNVLFTTFGSVRKDIKICNTNPCNGTKNCRTETVYVSSVNSTFNKTLNNSSEVLKIKVVPNPTNGLLTLTLNNPSNGNYSILDFTGIEIQKDQFMNQSEIKIALDEKIKNGIYTLKVYTETSGSFTRKIILNK